MTKSIGSCHGDENRDRIMREFIIWPLAYQTLVEGCCQQGCAGPLVDKYYMFGYRERAGDPMERGGTFFCGYVVGEDFLRRLNIRRMPLFDPLTAPVAPTLPALSVSAPSHEATSGPAAPEGMLERLDSPMHPLNIEVSQVINLLVALHNVVPTGPTLDTLGQIRDAQDVPVEDRRVRTLNNYIRAIFSGRTFQEYLAFRRGQVRRLRHYSFPLIRNILTRFGDTNYIDA